MKDIVENKVRMRESESRRITKEDEKIRNFLRNLEVVVSVEFPSHRVQLLVVDLLDFTQGLAHLIFPELAVLLRRISVCQRCQFFHFLEANIEPEYQRMKRSISTKSRDAGTYGARGAIAPLPFLAGGKGGKGALFQKYNINEI